MSNIGEVFSDIEEGCSVSVRLTHLDLIAASSSFNMTRNLSTREGNRLASFVSTISPTTSSSMTKNSSVTQNMKVLKER